MFVVEGLIRAVVRLAGKGICNPHGVGLRALLRWYSTQASLPPGDAPGWLVRDRRLHVQRAPGLTCLAALSARVASATHDLSPAVNDSKGCGGVVRAAPFGFLLSPEIAFEHACVNAGFTHGHPTGALAAGYLAAVVWELARGARPLVALEGADALLARHPAREETAEAVTRARSAAAGRTRLDGRTLEHLGGGWVAEEALAIALACLLQHDPDRSSVADTLWLAAAHGGDSDSTASITGNLLGAMLGADALPGAWLADLELRDIVERLARDLWSLMETGEDLDDRDYPGY